jgi:subtilisin family serine protease
MNGSRLLAWLTTAAIVGSLILAPAASAAPGPADAPEWWFDTWRVPSLWAGGADGRGITVAVVDTGVQGNIPELQGKVVAGADFIGNGTDGRTDFDQDQFSHGTAMASIIAARPGSFGIEGLAPGAQILPIAVPLKGVVRNGTPKPDATAESIKYAADHGARVISMSLGGIQIEGEDATPCPDKLQRAVIYALNKGSIVVAASGNSGGTGSPVEEPGVCLGVVSVGSVNSGMNVSAFSSRHPYLTLSAPGDGIATLNRDPGRAFVGGGTSQATAMTSAAIALVWSKYPTETNRQVLSRILTTVTDRGPVGRDKEYGFGVVNPEAALKATVTAATPNSVFDGVQPLLNLATAKAKTPPTKAVAGDPAASIGNVTVAKSAAVLGTKFLVLVGATAALAFLAILLLVAGLRRRPTPAPAPVVPASY